MYGRSPIVLLFLTSFCAFAACSTPLETPDISAEIPDTHTSEITDTPTSAADTPTSAADTPTSAADTTLFDTGLKADTLTSPDSKDPCEPKCTGLTCGDDGCGDSCGSCNGGEMCADGTCKEMPCGESPSCLCMIETCVPEFATSTVGIGYGLDLSCQENNPPYCTPYLLPEFLSGTCTDVRCTLCFPHNLECGVVAPNYLMEEGLCDDCICQGKCDGRVCGDDGCGGSCGVCGDQELCNYLGQCKPCTPECTGKACGYDQCTGICGTCSNDKTCTKGLCGPPLTCAQITQCFKDCVSTECHDDCLDSAAPDALISYENISACRQKHCGEIFDPNAGLECLFENCWFEYIVCFEGTQGTLNCQDISGCVEGCQGDSGCQQQCFAGSDPASANTFLALNLCLWETCGEAASAECKETSIAPEGACAEAYQACQ